MVTLPRTKVCGRKTLLSERDLTLRQKQKSKAFRLFFHRPPPQEKQRNKSHTSQGIKLSLFLFIYFNIVHIIHHAYYSLSFFHISVFYLKLYTHDGNGCEKRPPVFFNPRCLLKYPFHFYSLCKCKANFSQLFILPNQTSFFLLTSDKTKQKSVEHTNTNPPQLLSDI